MKSKIKYLLILTSIFGFQMSISVFVADAQEDDEGKTEIEFAEKRQLPVITYGMSGGFRGRPKPGKGTKPRLQIWPSGKVVCASSTSRAKDVESEIDGGELRELLEFIVNKQRFYELTDEGIKKAIADSGKTIYIADAPSSHIVVNLKRGEHKLKVYASKFTAQQIPKLEEIQRVVAIEGRLERMIASANLGGKKKARSILKFVNRRLKQEHPAVKSMTFDDLRTAQQLTDGSLAASFQTELVNEDDKSTSRLTVRYVRNENGEEDVKIYIFKNRK